VKVDRHLPGRSNVMRDTITFGYQQALFWLPSCGGVDIGINVTKKNFTKDTTKRLSKLKSLVLKTRPSQEALFWDYHHNSDIELQTTPNQCK
jgi:hypothetical protein